MIIVKTDYKTLKYLGLISQIGLNMAIPIFIGVFVGHWVDTKAGTNGLFLILFILMGIYISFRNLFTTVLKKIDNGKKDSKDE